jgi:hypothetical protein
MGAGEDAMAQREKSTRAKNRRISPCSSTELNMKLANRVDMVLIFLNNSALIPR